jgi:hypothetical protein
VERDTWRAETDADTAIAKGTEVEVLAVRGTRLVVANAQRGSDAERGSAAGTSPDAASDSLELE